jgi:two-component system, sensor histidine kinase and response regulator
LIRRKKTDPALAKRIRLSIQIARPLLLGGAIFALFMLSVLALLNERALTRELAGRAALLTLAAQNTAHPDWTEHQLLSHLLMLGATPPYLEQVALVDLSGSRILASGSKHRGGGSEASLSLDPLRHGLSNWRLDDYRRQVFATPLVSKELGNDLSLVMLLNGEELAAASAQNLNAVAVAMLLGVLLLSVGASGLVNRRVLDPIMAIRTAVVRRRQGQLDEEIPKVRDDEIGELADLLEQSLAEREQLDDRLGLLSRAIQGSSNEVYIIDAESLQVLFCNTAAARNLGYREAELRGMTVPDVAPAMRDPAYAADLAEQIAPANELRHTYLHCRKDGSHYPFEFTASRVMQNNRLLLIVLGNDVSQRERQAEALRLSEERLNLAVAGSSDGVFDFDVERGELFLSRRVREWLALPVLVGAGHELLEEAFARIHNEDLLTVRRAYVDALHRGRDCDLEFRYRSSRHEEHRWFQVRGRGTWSDNGVLLRISGVVSNVTRRKVAENLLHNSVARLGAVLDNIAEGIVTLDANGLVCAVNPAGESMLECDRETLVSQPFCERLEVPDSDWRSLADRQLRECVAVQASGECFPAEYAVSRLELGSDEQFIVVFRDISERKQAETQLHRALDEANAATRAKDEFLATMSHEIRTPMNGVLGMTQLLLGMDLNDEQRETAQVIYGSGEALLTIINDILDYSKIEARKLVFEASPFNFRVAISEVMDLLANNAAVDMYVDYPTQVPSHLLGDVGRVRQVLMNLVGNALKFTERGHVLVSVEDTAADDSTLVMPLRSFARLRVAVTDSGPGISEKAQRSLFESFTQADASTTRRYGGTGLGLAISKRLVELMGGEIGVSSRPGEGSTFYFTLNLPTYFEDLEQKNPPELRGMQALVVEDNPVGARIYRQALEKIGVGVKVAQSGRQALELIAAGAGFDFVLLDYHMPQMDGLELAQRLTRLKRLKQLDPALKLIMLSSSDIRGEPAVRSLDGYAVKPVLQDALYQLVARAFSSAPKMKTLSHHAPAEAASAVADGSRYRVLLAEDNAVNQKVAVRMLERLGCRVDVAANGVEALAMWERLPYDVVFMDCQMPEMDGLEATRQIRQLELIDEGHTPIVAMTANAMPKDQQDCLAAGMDDYLAKPVKIDQIEAVLVRWCASDMLPPPTRATIQQQLESPK